MTIKELSDKCGISEQSLRAWCKKNNISKATITNEGKATKPSYLITPETEAKILEYYGKTTSFVDEDEKKATKLKIESKEVNETNNEKATKLEDELIKQLSIKDDQLSVKDTQLAEKDKQIYELQLQNKALIEALNNAQENNKSLNDALVAAQTLHAATIQTAALEDKSAVPERKGFFRKIFRK